MVWDRILIKNRSIILDSLGLQVLEAFHWHMLHQNEHLVLGILILVPLARQTHTNAFGHIADTVCPDGLVQLGVNADVLGLHGLRRKLANLADCARSTLLELDPVQVLVHVDGVITRAWLLRFTTLVGFAHFSVRPTNSLRDAF